MDKQRQSIHTDRDYLRPAPAAWVVRLREVSPVTDRLAHLVFRWREPKDFWLHSDQGQWQLYAATPKHLCTADRAACFDRHWTELSPTQQKGRQSTVTDYQHFMWHTHGVDVALVATIQGPSAYTPARYTVRERRYLDAVGAMSEPFPLGFFPAQPFDERTVRHILDRDRLEKVGGDLDALEAQDRPEAVQAEFEAAEKEHRAAYLKTWSALMAPCQEYLKSQLFKTQVAPDLKPAPEGLADKLATWKETFIETGVLVGATNAVTTQSARPIAGATPALVS